MMSCAITDMQIEQSAIFYFLDALKSTLQITGEHIFNYS